MTVSNPGITLSATNMTISSPSPGNSGTSTITLTSTGGYAGTATVSASASTLNANYGFGSTGAQTANVALSSGGTGSTTITITTVAASGNFKKGPAGNFRKTAAPDCSGGRNSRRLHPLASHPGNPAKEMAGCARDAGLPERGCGAGLRWWGPCGGAPAGTYTVTVYRS